MTKKIIRLMVGCLIVAVLLQTSCAPTAPQNVDISITDNAISISTDAYEIQFEDGVITQVTNRITAEVYTLPTGLGGNSGILRSVSGAVWTSQSEVTEITKLDPLRIKMTFSQGQNEISMFVAVDADTGDLVIEQEAVADSGGVYGIQWGIGNLDVSNLELILPAHGGQRIDAGSPQAYIDVTYPGAWEWEAQLAIIQGQRGGFSVRSEDETFQHKVLHYERGENSFALGFETQNQAPFDTLKFAKSVTWRLNTYAGDWRVPAGHYRSWMEQTFNPRPLSGMPSWVEGIGLVVILRGELDMMVLNRLVEQTDPTKTLLYIPDWRKDGYDVNYPEYTARAGFGSFVEAAHQRGFRVMVHTNLVGVSPNHPAYANLQESQFRDPWGQNLVGWMWEQTQSPTRIAFINPADSAFRKLFVQRLREVWEEYHVDAFHLDTSLVVMNDANGLIEGLNSAQGNALLHEELAEAMPQVAFSGEGLNEVTFFRESFAQRAKVPQGVEPHPISAYLFSRYTLPYGHLGLPNPDSNPQLYNEYLDSYEVWGVLPTLALGEVEWTSEDIYTETFLSVARAWQQFGLRPDFDKDWEDETLFQYVGQAGGIATLRRTETGSILVLPGDSVGYERVSGTTHVTTDRSLPDWRAYNETAILGLNPERSYLLSDMPRDHSQLHINSLPEGVCVTEARVTNNVALFRLESEEIDLLSMIHLARTGSVVNGVILALEKGATFHLHEASVSGGILKPAIDAHPPWQNVSGDAFGEFTISLPDDRSISLEFDIGLRDGSEKSDGVTFIVHLQGREIFRKHYKKQSWQHLSLDLTPYGGQQVVLRLTTNSGSNGDTGWDWAQWGEPKIVLAPVGTHIQPGFFVPDEPLVILPDGIRSSGQGQYYLETKLPALVLFLFEPVQQVALPYDLRDAQFTAGFQCDHTLRYRSFYGSGERTSGTSGGVRKATIFAHPPAYGQTVIQFLLYLPQTERITFSFSMGLGDGSCSEGLFFKVLLNGQDRFEHFTKTPGWVDASIPMSDFAGETVLLELVTDSDGSPNCDWAHWADLLITTE